MATEKLSILIETMFNNIGIKNAASQIKVLENQVQSMSRTVGGGAFDLSRQLGEQSREFLVNNALLKKYNLFMVAGEKSLKSFTTGTSATTTEVSQLTRAFATGDWERNKQRLITNTKAMQSLGLQAEESRQQFKMWYLSLLFFGMVIQRMFLRLATTTMTAYMKITEGTTAASEGIMVLTAAWETLKFSIGSAIAETLEPLIPLILDIITAIIDWVDTHPRLTAGIIAVGVVLGTLITLFGQVMMGIEMGLIPLFKQLSTIFAKFALPVIGDMGLGALLGILALVIIAIAALVAAWKTNFAGIRDFVENELWIIWDTFKLIFRFIIDVFKDFIMVFEGIFEGDVNKIKEGVKNLIEDVVGFVLKLTVRIVALVGNIIILIIRALVGLGTSIFKVMLGIQEKIEKVFVNIKWSIVQAFESAVNWVISKILNPLIKKLSDITIFGAKPFEWLKGVQIEPLIGAAAGRAEELGKISDKYNTIRDSVSKVNDVVQDNLDYVGKDAIAWADEAIDAQINYSKSITTVGDASITTKSNIDSLSYSIDNLNKKSSIAIPELTLPTTKISTFLDTSSVNYASESIDDLGMSIDPLQDKLAKAKEIFGTPGGKDGLNARISYMGDSLNLPIKKSQELSATTQSLQSSAAGLGEFLTNTFNKQVQSSTTALLSDADAANAAASAQERYNRAKQGATKG